MVSNATIKREKAVSIEWGVALTVVGRRRRRFEHWQGRVQSDILVVLVDQASSWPRKSELILTACHFLSRSFCTETSTREMRNCY